MAPPEPASAAEPAIWSRLVRLSLLATLFMQGGWAVKHLSPAKMPIALSATLLFARYPERGEGELELGGGERYQMGAVVIEDERTQLTEQGRSLQELLAQGAGGAVHRRDQKQALAGLAGDDARQQVQVIIDDLLEDGLRGDVDQPGARLAEQEQEEEIAFLIGLEDGAAQRQVERKRRYDDDGLRVLIEGANRTPERHKPGLEHLEARLGLVRRQAQGVGREVVHGRLHCQIGYRFRCDALRAILGPA